VSFSTLLVANRGEIARRVMRSAHEMGMRCVAVYVDADADALFVLDADEAVQLSTNYLDQDAIIAAALSTGAEAIHPGYGFLSENATFAAAVVKAGLVWVGPSPASIGAMGDKLAAKKLAIELGVPTLQYSSDPKDAESIGYPILVKASAGGGGKGMRVVSSAGDLDESVAAAQREALSGFGDDTIFIEHYVATSRHVEIQILGDTHGNLIHLGERECSIQRRHQKLVEESPSPIVDSEMRSAMGEAALTLARHIGYVSAGTVEFLVDDDTREFFFLEVNTRLQVEHPVTEEVTGIDLVREQLRIAAGEELSVTQNDVQFTGHAIEVRLCAEDPLHGFLPATGTLHAFSPAAQPVVRWESGVGPGSVVGVSFDPMLAKVIAHAPTRFEAASRLALALERLHIGGVSTNRDFLASTLRHEAFLAGDTTTDFIERHRPTLGLEIDDEGRRWLAIAATLWLQGQRREQATVLASAPSGWRNARLPLPDQTLTVDGHDEVVQYRANRDGSFNVDGIAARIHSRSDREIDLQYNARRARVAITRHGERMYLQTRRGTVAVDIVPRFVIPGAVELAGGLTAPMPGTILSIRVKVGDFVTKGDALVVMEAMKMEHQIVAPSDGHVVELLVDVGQQVENGAALLVLEESPGDDGGGNSE
jgi:propionyl-CoA carboxylase alpha chain